MGFRTKLFNDISHVGIVEKVILMTDGLLNHDGTVVGWAKLAPILRDRKITQLQAKQLVLLELKNKKPRRDTLNRLASYLSYYGKEETMVAIDKLLEKKK